MYLPGCSLLNLINWGWKCLFPYGILYEFAGVNLCLQTPFDKVFRQFDTFFVKLTKLSWTSHVSIKFTVPRERKWILGVSLTHGNFNLTKFFLFLVVFTKFFHIVSHMGITLTNVGSIVNGFYNPRGEIYRPRRTAAGCKFFPPRGVKSIDDRADVRQCYSHMKYYMKRFVKLTANRAHSVEKSSKIRSLFLWKNEHFSVNSTQNWTICQFTT